MSRHGQQPLSPSARVPGAPDACRTLRFALEAEESILGTSLFHPPSKGAAPHGSRSRPDPRWNVFRATAASRRTGSWDERRIFAVARHRDSSATCHRSLGSSKFRLPITPCPREPGKRPLSAGWVTRAEGISAAITAAYGGRFCPDVGKLESPQNPRRGRLLHVTPRPPPHPSFTRLLSATMHLLTEHAGRHRAVPGGADSPAYPLASAA